MKYTYYRYGKLTGSYGYVKIRYIKSRDAYKVWRLYPRCEDTFYGGYYHKDDTGTWFCSRTQWPLLYLRKLKSRPSQERLRQMVLHNQLQNPYWNDLSHLMAV